MSIRARLFLVFVLCASAVVWGLVQWLHTQMQPRYLEAQEDLLVDISALLAGAIEARGLDDTGAPLPAQIAALLDDMDSRRIDARIYDLHKQAVDLRVYVTDRFGTVVYDSTRRDVGADYHRWRDVDRTLAGEYGARTSADDPLFPDGSVMYVGAPLIGPDGIAGVVSVGKPTRNAERFLDAAIRRFTWAGVGGLLAALLVALVLTHWVSRPLQRLHGYARELRSGRRVPLPRLGNNEIGRVGAAMSELRDALDGKAYVEHYVQALTHELKSPTAAIRGAAELLGEDMPAEDRRRFTDNIRAESLRLQDLIDRMLQLAAIENRAPLEAPQTVDLVAVVDRVVAGLGPLIRQAGLRVDRRADGDARLAGDAFLVELAVSNLLKNAVDFSPEGATVRIDCRGETGPGAMLRLSIVDQGPGIPDYARARIFERFYSLPRAGGRKGTGLGLSFVREIAALHGGSVRLDAAEGGGTCAELTLPRAQG